ncbi:hypothetical protein J416_01354 [Gracilibacillus halophilus YIM-C55.5]|uniref:endopeptidase La n=1 Tax=Gracilibacillus halophilus YIM-C55.5 TaxID=1308866 RepID=N4WGF4_9BACI|nr:SepM family pheromone-processing serine protease [Gracilibacillus halophilus]ENH98344.1 hypothetical protein J416_01354 [Gracilibacillus halophilus YIM-C55.5]
MFKNKGKILFIILLVVCVFVLFNYQLPYYIQKPGSADPLDPVISVGDDEESEGDMHLVTIQGGQATILSYLIAKLQDHQEILPIEEVLQNGMSQEEYMDIQLLMMENSQEASTVVAYKAANKKIDIQYKGIYVVSIVDGSPAQGILETGDKIVRIDQQKIVETKDLLSYVENKDAGDTIEVFIERDDETWTEEITLESMPELDGEAGIGIQLVTNREVSEEPPVEFSSGDIGGPSAGLMFSLEIYDQLTDQDLTNGLQVAGTGEIDYEGNIGPIGGVDKKVIAADQENCDLFFVPKANAEVANRTAEEINTDMEIVTVEDFTEAVNYLKEMNN